MPGLHADGEGTRLHLLLISLGPVQDFIAAARRCRDLWFGSWLLSELSKAAAGAVAHVAHDKAESLVFPSVQSLADLAPNSSLNVANKILAVVDDPAGAARAAQEAASRRLRDICEQSFAQVGRNDLVDWTRARAQITDLLEFYWVSVPQSGEGSWKQDRNRVEALMAARKNTRTFSPVTWGGALDKSSLDGQRESVVSAALDEAKKDGARGHLQLRRWVGIRPGENLCGVGLMKRHGGSLARQGIFSTSHVAALPILERLQKADTEPLERYVDALRQAGIETDDLGYVDPPHPVFGRLDGHILFAERLVDVLPKEHLEEATRALRSFLASIHVSQPSPYYALLLADGDRMGQAIDACDTRKKHRSLSSELARFAREAGAIVKSHGGSLVYAGGDDVMALIGVHRAVACARALADCFARLMKDFSYSKDGVTTLPTLSVGIGVAHHIQPLSDTLDLARRAERAAKVHRNALAVVVSKRSGSDMVVSGSWDSDGIPPLDSRLTTWARMHRDDALPDGAAYELHALGRRLPPGEAALRPVIALECKRILARKQPGHGAGAALAREDRDALVQALQIDAALHADQPAPPLDVQAVASELIVARLLADAEELASPNPEREPMPV